MPWLEKAGEQTVEVRKEMVWRFIATMLDDHAPDNEISVFRVATVLLLQIQMQLSPVSFITWLVSLHDALTSSYHTCIEGSVESCDFSI